MKATLKILMAALAMATGPLFAGFDSPEGVPDSEKSADGEPIPRPQRPNPHFNPNLPDQRHSTIPADPIPATTRDKVEQSFIEEIKNDLGSAAIPGLTGPQIQARYEAEYERRVDEVFGAGTWAAGTPVQRDAWRAVLRQGATGRFMTQRVWNTLRCELWDNLSAMDKETKLNEKKDAALVEMLGQAAFDALTPAEKTAKRNSLAADKVDAMRCNIEFVIGMLECTDPAVAKCIRETWYAGRLCVDFKSEGAAGMMRPNPDGRPNNECDPDKNPINIGLGMFPCKKVTDCADPAIYGLFTTLLHEGTHAIQIITAALPNNPTDAQCADKAKERVALEQEAHGKENTFIDTLCVPLLTIIGGGEPAPTTNDLANKIAAKIAVLPAGANIAAAILLKIETLKNKISNDAALAYYAKLDALAMQLKMGTITKAQFRQQRSALRKIDIRHRSGTPDEVVIIAGGETNQVEQTAFDPVTGNPFSSTFAVPVDIITEVILSPDGNFLFTFGSEIVTGDGVVHAFQDQNGDGFFDDFTGNEIIRDSALFGAIDANVHPFFDRFMVVNLWTGDVIRLFEPSADELVGNPVPTAAEPAGFMDFSNSSPSTIIWSDDFTTVYGHPYLSIGPFSTLEPQDLIVRSALDLAQLAPDFQPVLPVDPFVDNQFPPIILQAGPLPVLTTTGTVNSTTTDLLVGGMPNQTYELILTPPAGPPVLFGPITLNGVGQGNFVLPIPPNPDDVLQIVDPSGGPNSAEYFVRDPSPQLINPIFIPGAGLQVDLFGVPGMPYQLLFSPDLVVPFQPISPLAPPIIGGELPLPIPPDPALLGLELYHQAVVLTEVGG